MARAQVDLVSEKSESRSQPLTQFFLNLRHFTDHFAAELRRHRGEPLVSVVASQRKRHDRYARNARIIRSEIED